MHYNILCGVDMIDNLYTIHSVVRDFIGYSKISVLYIYIYPLPDDPSSYYPPIYAWVSQVVFFPLVSPPKPCIHLSSPHTPYMILTSHSSRFYDPKSIW